MYQIPHTEYYKLYDYNVDDFIDYFYSKWELIEFISKFYRSYNVEDGKLVHKSYYNHFIDKCACSLNELENGDFYNYKRYILYDNYDRIINIKDFQQDSLDLFIKNGEEPYSYFNYLWNWQNRRLSSAKFRRRKVISDKSFRKDPIPHTGKIKGGPWWHSPHTAGIIRMYKNPEYKEYNRGTWHKIPTWWDDRTRCVQRSWKEQGKYKYQWEKNLDKLD